MMGKVVYEIRYNPKKYKLFEKKVESEKKNCKAVNDLRDDITKIIKKMQGVMKIAGGKHGRAFARSIKKKNLTSFRKISLYFKEVFGMPFYTYQTYEHIEDGLVHVTIEAPISSELIIKATERQQKLNWKILDRGCKFTVLEREDSNSIDIADERK